MNTALFIAVTSAIVWKIGFLYLSYEMAGTYWRNQKFWLVVTLFFDVLAIFLLLMLGQRSLPNKVINFRRVVKATGRIPENFQEEFSVQYQSQFEASDKEIFERITNIRGAYFANVFAAERYFFRWSDKQAGEASASAESDYIIYAKAKVLRDQFSDIPASSNEYVDKIRSFFATDDECGIIKKDDEIIVCGAKGVSAYLSVSTYKDSFKKWNEMSEVTDARDKLFILSKVLVDKLNWNLKPLTAADC
jgi:hypothetical protein